MKVSKFIRSPHIWTLAGMLVFLTGCNKENTNPMPPTKNINVVFRATYDGQTLEQGKDYIYSGTSTVDFLRFTMYISDLILTDGKSETKLFDIQFLDFFNNPNTPKAQDQIFSIEKVPATSFSGIKIGFGVRPDLNSKRPSDFPSGHPLANEIEYWLGWKSYIFSKIEANADLDNQPGKEVFLNYHCGSSTSRDVYRTGTKPVNIDFSGEKNALIITFDLKKVFEFNGRMLNIQLPDNQFTGTSPNDLGMAELLLGNFIHATSTSQ